MKNDTQTATAHAVGSSDLLGDADGARTEKWFWKMNYCKKRGLAPAQNHIWNYVETKWQEAHAPNK